MKQKTTDFSLFDVQPSDPKTVWPWAEKIFPKHQLIIFYKWKLVNISVLIRIKKIIRLKILVTKCHFVIFRWTQLVENNYSTLLNLDRTKRTHYYSNITKINSNSLAYFWLPQNIIHKFQFRWHDQQINIESFVLECFN